MGRWSSSGLPGRQRSSLLLVIETRWGATIRPHPLHRRLACSRPRLFLLPAHDPVHGLPGSPPFDLTPRSPRRRRAGFHVGLASPSAPSDQSCGSFQRRRRSEASGVGTQIGDAVNDPKLRLFLDYAPAAVAIFDREDTASSRRQPPLAGNLRTGRRRYRSVPLRGFPRHPRAMEAHPPSRLIRRSDHR